MKKLLSLTLALCVCSAANAGTYENRSMRYALGTLLSAVALNAAAATRTATVSLDSPNDGYDLLILHIDHSNNAATDVQMSCEIQPDATSTDAVMQDCTVATGVCTSTDASWSNAVSGDEVFIWRVDISGYPGQVECTFSGTSAGASDLITVKGWMTTK